MPRVARKPTRKTKRKRKAAKKPAAPPVTVVVLSVESVLRGTAGGLAVRWDAMRAYWIWDDGAWPMRSVEGEVRVSHEAREEMDRELVELIRRQAKGVTS